MAEEEKGGDVGGKRRWRVATTGGHQWWGGTIESERECERTKVEREKERRGSVTTPTLTGSGPLVLQISRTKRTEFPLKLDYIQA